MPIEIGDSTATVRSKINAVLTDAGLNPADNVDTTAATTLLNQAATLWDVDVTFVDRMPEAEFRAAFVALEMVVWNPVSLFANGESGWIFDPTTTNLFQDSAGTIPVVASDDPVGRIVDQSPSGNNGTQATSANRPLFKVADGVRHLLFDGTDAINTIFIPTTALTMAAAFRVADTASHAVLGGGISTGNKRAFIGTNNGLLTVGWGAETFGSTSNSYGSSLVGIDAAGIVTGDLVSRDLWLDNTLLDSRAPSGGPDGTGGGLTLGNYNNNGVPAASYLGRLNRALAINRRVTPAEVARITAWLRRGFF